MTTMPLLPIMATPVAPLHERTGESYRTSSDLTDTQRWLLQIMRKHQFGRVENLAVHAGQPVPDRSVRVIRVARLGGESGGTTVPAGDEFELKQAARDLFDDLKRLKCVQ